MSHTVLEIDGPDIGEAEAAEAIRPAIGAISMHANAEAVLELSNERIGELVRAGLARMLPLTRREGGLASVQVRTGGSSRNGMMVARGRGAPSVELTTEATEPESESSVDFQVGMDAIIAGRMALVDNELLLTSGQIDDRKLFTRQSLSEAVKSGRMFRVEVGSKRYVPAFFFRGKVDRPKIEAVAKLLGPLPGWSKWQFFTTPKESLRGLTPLEALAKGKTELTEAVAEAAAAFAER
jgi:hypothetical protein